MYKDLKKKKEYGVRYYLSNRKKFLEKSSKIKIPPAVAKNYKLKFLYKITIEDFNAMYDKQKGLCAICLQGKKLVVDHCHKTKKVRGLLCYKCNVAIGMAGDNCDTLKKAIDYLNTSKKI